jgi:hypothetical protein
LAAKSFLIWNSGAHILLCSHGAIETFIVIRGVLLRALNGTTTTLDNRQQTTER